MFVVTGTVDFVGLHVDEARVVELFAVEFVVVSLHFVFFFFFK